MTTGHSSAKQPPIKVHSVHFDFPGGQAIHLVDHVSGRHVGEAPEWVTGQATRPVAYVRATTPRVRIVFRGTAAQSGEYQVGADGIPCGVSPTQVRLAFDSVFGLSQVVDLVFSDPLPDAIGVHTLKIDWYTAKATSPEDRQPVATSTHELCTTWRPMQPDSGQRLEDWTYSHLVRWTSQWAAGADDEKEICDAIIRNVASSGLRYGLSVQIAVRTIGQMLNRGEGMCGNWYQMFQQMAHSQGVFVHRRSFLVNWQPLSNGESRWCAIVILKGGLNRTRPAHPEGSFRDHDGHISSVRTATLIERKEFRYRFWGKLGDWNDGHCINFLEHNGKLYLYDACFGTGPVEVDGPLPPDDLTIWGGRQLETFKTRYLDTAVDYMLGALYNRGQFWPVSRASGTTPEQLGVSVRTSQIPETDGGVDGISFGWGG